VKIANQICPPSSSACSPSARTVSSCFISSSSCAWSGAKATLDRDAVDADRRRHIAEHAAPELPQRESRKLVRVLPANECIVEDEDVVEVVVGVVVGEVGGASQQRRVRLRLPAVVANDELLMEDLRVEVALDLDPVAKQRCEDDAIDRERLPPSRRRPCRRSRSLQGSGTDAPRCVRQDSCSCPSPSPSSGACGHRLRPRRHANAGRGGCVDRPACRRSTSGGRAAIPCAVRSADSARRHTWLGERSREVPRR
jgi:hypothetical protein